MGGAGAGAGRDATTGWRNSGTDRDGDGWPPPIRRCAAAGAVLGASGEASCAASLTVLVLVFEGVEDEIVAGVRRWANDLLVTVGEKPCAFALNLLLLLDANARERRCFFFFCLSMTAGLTGLEGATCCDKGASLSLRSIVLGGFSLPRGLYNNL